MFPHVDSFLYLDTDVIILSNMTETWLHFKELQQSDALAVAAFSELLPKPARGLYSQTSQVPYYGHSGKYVMNAEQGTRSVHSVLIVT